MATAKGSAEKRELPQRKLWHNIEEASLQALATIKFSTEDNYLYPSLCKQHLWQHALFKGVSATAKLEQGFPLIQLMHGAVACELMDSFSFHMDAAFRSTQFSKEELTFLRKIRLEHFLCEVPWGVLHTERAAEVVNTLQEDTMTVTLKGEVLPLFSEDWRNLFGKIFQLSPKTHSEAGKWTLHELFPSLKAVQKGQTTVKIADCQAAGSKRPLRLLSSFFCLNTTNQYNITIHFAELVLATLNGQAVDWPLEFLDEFKAEIISLHRHQQEQKAKVVKTAIGPHLTLIINEAELLGSQERGDAGFDTTAGLTITERTPQPKKRKLGEESAAHLEKVVRVVPRPPLYSPRPSPNPIPESKAQRSTLEAGGPSK